MKHHAYKKGEILLFTDDIGYSASVLTRYQASSCLRNSKLFDIFPIFNRNSGQWTPGLNVDCSAVPPCSREESMDE